MEQEVISFKGIADQIVNEELQPLRELLQRLIAIEKDYNDKKPEHPIALFIDFRH